MSTTPKGDRPWSAGPLPPNLCKRRTLLHNKTPADKTKAKKILNGGSDVIRNNWKKLALVGVVGLPALALFVYSQLTIRVGYVVVNPDPQSQVPVGTALFSFRNPDGVLVSEAGVGAVEPIRRGRVFVDPAARTGVALANPSEQTIILDLTLRDRDGQTSPLGPAMVTMGPREHISRFVDEFFPGFPAGFIGSLTFETRQANQAVAAITIRQRSNNRVPAEPLSATLPVVDLDQPDSGRQTLVFPHIGAGSILSTQIILINRSGQRTSGLIRLTSSDGTPLVVTMGNRSSSEFSYTLEPNGVFVADFTNNQGVVQGYAEVTLTQGSQLPAGTAIFQFTSQNGPVSEAGVADIAPTGRARIFIDNNNTQTGVAIASPGNAALTVTFDLLDRNGLFIDRRTRQIPASGHLAIFADELFELPQDFTGQMDISAPLDFVPITLKFTTNTRGEFILTTLPVADLEQPVQAAFLVFPQVGFGSLPGIGSFSTRLIYLNTATATASRGVMAFFRSDGTGLVVPLGGLNDSQFTYDVSESGARQFFPGVEAGLALIFIDQSNLVVNQDETAGLRPVTLDEDGNARDDFPLDFTSLDTNVVTVDENGTLTGVNRGFSTVTVSAQGMLVTVSVTVATITAGADGLDVTGVAQDFGRRIFLSNTSAHTILTADDISEEAGLFAGVARLPGFLNSSREESRFDRPTFIALNQSNGSLYVSDSANHAIRVVRTGPEGGVTTLAGDRQRPGSLDGTLAQASFMNPQGLSLDSFGRLWVVDSGNHTIRRINLADGTVVTVAGAAGQAGFQNGQAGAARFNAPRGIALEAESLERQLERALNGEPPPPVTMIVADTGNGVLRRVREDGQVTTIQASATAAVATRDGKLGSVNTNVRFTNPTGVVVDSFGTIFVSEPTAARVRALLADGEVVQAAQSGTFENPRGMAITTRGRIVVAELSRSVQEIRYAGPSIQAVQPNRITSGVDTLITVRGRNFASDTRVILGGAVIRNAQVVDTSTVVFTAGANLPNGRLPLTLIHRGGLDEGFLLVDATPPSELAAGEIATVAGGSPFSGDLGLAELANFNEPAGIAFDSAGNLYVADAASNRVRRIDAVTRIVTTVAGQSKNRLSIPLAVAVDENDNVFIADSGNNRILRWSRADEVLETVAGTGEAGFSGDGGPALEATLDEPSGVAVGSNGDVYVADTGNGRIRRISASNGHIDTFAGGPMPDGVALTLTAPVGLFFGANDVLFAADPDNDTVWRINTRGVIARFAGNGLEGFSGDGGPAANARLSAPSAVAVDSDGNVLIADSGNHRIRVVRSGDVIQTVAGNGIPDFSGDGGFAGNASLNSPLGLGVNTAGDLFVADTRNQRIRRVAANQAALSSLSLIFAYAGTGDFPDVVDGDDADWAALDFPAGLAFDADGNLYVADADHQRVRRISNISLDSNGKARIDTVAGTGERGFGGEGGPAVNAVLNEPMGVAFTDSGDLLFSDSDNHVVRRVNANSGGSIPSFVRLGNTTAGGSIVAFVGNLERGYSGDGEQAHLASLDFPSGLAQADKQLYIADQRNHRIRVVDLDTRIISTLAGNGEAGFSGDGGPALEASLNSPHGLAVHGQLFVADTDNHRIRRIDLGSGVITTVAGNGQHGFSGDGGPATQASLNRPTAIAFDPDGNMVIADSGNNRLRVVDGQGRITTLAGDGGEGFGGDGGPALDARLNGVGGLAIDSDGNIYLADLANHRVRIIRRR